MHRTLLLIGLLAAVSCGGSTPTATTATSPSPVAAATVSVANNAKLGQILVDGNGRTLYLFEADKGSSSTCYGPCATFWPPLLTGSAAQAGAGANGSLLGTTKRTDGTTEVTYNGHPLYYVVTDHNPGDVTGQGINNFGAPWDAVGPDGSQVG